MSDVRGQCECVCFLCAVDPMDAKVCLLSAVYRVDSCAVFQFVRLASDSLQLTTSKPTRELLAACKCSGRPTSLDEIVQVLTMLTIRNNGMFSLAR